MFVHAPLVLSYQPPRPSPPPPMYEYRKRGLIYTWYILFACRWSAPSHPTQGVQQILTTFGVPNDEEAQRLTLQSPKKFVRANPIKRFFALLLKPKMMGEIVVLTDSSTLEERPKRSDRPETCQKRIRSVRNTSDRSKTWQIGQKHVGSVRNMSDRSKTWQIGQKHVGSVRNMSDR